MLTIGLFALAVTFALCWAYAVDRRVVAYGDHVDQALTLVANPHVDRRQWVCGL